MSEGARPAVADDVARLVELHDAQLEAIAGRRGGSLHLLAERQGATGPSTGQRASAATMAARFSEAIGSERSRTLVGTYDGAVVGFAAGHVEELTDGSWLGVVDDLFVEPDARGVGVGEALLSGITSWLEERGCVGVDARVLPGDRSTKALFESSGYKARLLVMHREPRP